MLLLLRSIQKCGLCFCLVHPHQNRINVSPTTRNLFFVVLHQYVILGFSHIHQNRIMWLRDTANKTQDHIELFKDWNLSSNSCIKDYRVPFIRYRLDEEWLEVEISIFKLFSSMKTITNRMVGTTSLFLEERYTLQPQFCIVFCYILYSGRYFLSWNLRRHADFPVFIFFRYINVFRVAIISVGCSSSKTFTPFQHHNKATI